MSLVSDAQITEAVSLYHRVYISTFPVGGDAGDHEDAIREGVAAVMLHLEAIHVAVWQQLLDDVVDGKAIEHLGDVTKLAHEMGAVFPS
ncbi:MAG: hypothetical protein WKF96_00040 [Solirubrobacteraceae bacterium]